MTYVLSPRCPYPTEKDNYITKIATGHIVILKEKRLPSFHMASLQSDWSHCDILENHFKWAGKAKIYLDLVIIIQVLFPNFYFIP